jgi:two-component system sensor histidine kinase KdpD
LKRRLEEWILRLDLPPYPIIVECDQARIETVIVNLLENSMKYAPPGTELSISADARGGYALFKLIDEGPGVPAGKEDLIFEKFYRTPSTTAKGGTGLGLAICKAIIDRHKGKIGVSRGVEGGAEFWFSLPLVTYDLRDR